MLMTLDVVVPIVTPYIRDGGGHTDACRELATSCPFGGAQVGSSRSKVEVRIYCSCPPPSADPSKDVLLSTSKTENLQSAPQKLGHMDLIWTEKEYL